METTKTPRHQGGATHPEPDARVDVVARQAVETVRPVHAAQILTYLKLTGYRLGLLVNFNVPRIRDGIRRFAL
jgi:GxxExxY protein